MSDQLQPKTYGLFDGPRSATIVPVIEARGDSVVRFPYLEHVAAAISDDDFDESLDGCEILVLTDVVAAEEFVARLDEFSVDPARLDGIAVCALGEAVADRLRFVQVHADIIPPRTDAATVAEAVSSYFGDLTGLVIVVGGESERDYEIAAILDSKGAAVRRLGLYRFEPAPAGGARPAALLAGGGIDRFVFCEPRDVLMLERIAEPRSPLELLRETAALAVSEVEFCSLQEAGLRPLYFKR